MPSAARCLTLNIFTRSLHALPNTRVTSCGPVASNINLDKLLMERANGSSASSSSRRPCQLCTTRYLLNWLWPRVLGGWFEAPFLRRWSRGCHYSIRFPGLAHTNLLSGPFWAAPEARIAGTAVDSFVISELDGLTMELACAIHQVNICSAGRILDAIFDAIADIFSTTISIYSRPRASSDTWPTSDSLHHLTELG
jgi:hypothetical protein